MVKACNFHKVKVISIGIDDLARKVVDELSEAKS